METKTVPEYLYEGLGFPVILLNVPLVKAQGVWAPRINYNHLQKQVLFALAKSPSPLIGDEIAFIRNALRMTLDEFGRALGVRHSAVLKWESQGEMIAKATPTTELCIRLLILERLNADDDLFRTVFRDFDMEKLTRMQRDPPPHHPHLSFSAASPNDEEACG